VLCHDLLTIQKTDKPLKHIRTESCQLPWRTKQHLGVRMLDPRRVDMAFMELRLDIDADLPSH
jgi:hypothetical protein